MRVGVTGRTQFADALHLPLLDGGVDPKNRRRSRCGLLKPVNTDDYGLAGLDLLLVFEGRVLDFALDEALFDGAQRSAHFVDPCDIHLGSALNVIRQFFDIFAAAQGIRRRCHVAELEAEGAHGEARRAYRTYLSRMQEIGAEPAAFPASRVSGRA